MSKSWGRIGAWAEEAERTEEEERERQAAAAAAVEPQSFPSLKESAAAAAKPKNKKKTMALSEFNYGMSVAPGSARRDHAAEPKGLTPDEMLRLPTGPRERSAEEMEQGRLGGGFRNYGRTSMPQERSREGGDYGGRRSYGGFDDERRGPPSSRVSDFDQPSRADEVDNWAMAKKTVPLMDSGRHDRYGSLGGGPGGSRADGVDNWAAGKQERVPARSVAMSFGSGFRDSGSYSGGSDRWTRGGGGGGGGGGVGGGRDEERERPRIVLDPPRGDGGGSSEPARTNRSNPFGAARPREDVLAEKGLDWRKLDTEIETKKMSRPTSSHSSRPSSAHSSRPQSPGQQVIEGPVAKPRPRVNPFGEAKPREVLLEEKGKDWRKIDLDLEHRGVDRPETVEEKMLKEEISHLKKELEKEAPSANGESTQESGGDQTNLHELLHSREKDLELLIRELDDKVRFGQKAMDRPGSARGRGVGFSERPPSQSGMPHEPRNMEFRDRPPSRGTDPWSRAGDDRRSFQGGRERGGFLSSRDDDRSGSRERW